MVQRFVRFFSGVALAAVLLSQASAQNPGKDPPKKDNRPAPNEVTRPGEEYRQFFKKPTNTAEFWAALDFEIEVGKFDLAAGVLRGMLEFKPPKPDLVKLEEK